MKIHLTDIVCIVAVAVLAAVSALPMLIKGDGSRAVVEYDGGSFTLPLESEGVHDITSNGHTLTVTVLNGEVFVSRSDCPDGLCKRQGAISKEGETIVCLPARVMVQVAGRGGVDNVAG